MCKRKLILSRILSRFGAAVDGVRPYATWLSILQIIFRLSVARGRVHGMCQRELLLSRILPLDSMR
jgi:hypothetical protein